MNSKKRILIVEDSADLRVIVAKQLTKAGYEVTAAAGAIEALQLLAQQPFDLIISDVMMPHGSGSDLFNAAKDFKQEIPIIFMTGLDDVSIEVLRANGMKLIIQKPITEDELLWVVAAELASH